MINIEQILQEHIDTVQAIRPLVGKLESLARLFSACLAKDGKILWMGNGGSAADCQHLAAELVGRYQRERRGFASIALTTDTSVLTAVANDYGFDQVFARQIDALYTPGDIVIGISTSGNSTNVIKALELARERGAITAGFTGETGGAMLARVDHCLRVPSQDAARIQEMHILMGHVLCDWVEASMVAGDKDA